MASTILDRKTVITQTTDATELTALTYTIPDDAVATFRLGVRAMELASGDSAFMLFVGGFKRAGTGNATAITSVQGNLPVHVLASDLFSLSIDARDDEAWDADIVLSGNDLQVKVTGEASKTIEWNLRLEIDQFSVLG